MPEMRKETAPRAATINAGDITVEATPTTAGVPKERRWNTNQTNLIIPAGAYSVHIRHIDPAGGNISINGEDLAFNQFYERSNRVDLVNKKQDFTPEVTLANPLGRTVAISVSYPSSSNVNPDLL